MDLNLLTNDEFIIECEIRNFHGSAIDSYNLLKTQLEAEKVTPVLIPTRAHLSARKNPKREIAKCSGKLNALKILIKKLSSTSEAKEILQLQSKLLHVEGRLSRISRSRTVKNALPKLGETLTRLRLSLGKWTSGDFNDIEISELNRTMHDLDLGDEDSNDSDSDSEPESSIHSKSSKYIGLSEHYAAPSGTSNLATVTSDYPASIPGTSKISFTGPNPSAKSLSAVIEERVAALGNPLVITQPEHISTSNPTANTDSIMKGML